MAEIVRTYFLIWNIKITRNFKFINFATQYRMDINLKSIFYEY